MQQIYENDMHCGIQIVIQLVMAYVTVQYH